MSGGRVEIDVDGVDRHHDARCHHHHNEQQVLACRKEHFKWKINGSGGWGGSETDVIASVLKILKKVQNTQKIKRLLFNWTKQDKTWKFSRKSSFSSYVQHKNKEANN